MGAYRLTLLDVMISHRAQTGRWKARELVGRGWHTGRQGGTEGYLWGTLLRIHPALWRDPDAV